MMHWYDGGMGPLGWLMMGAFWAALLALIIWLAVRLLPAGRDSGAAPRRESPEEILDRRFALGEIDEPTYTAQRTALAAARARDGRDR
jgi:putative membrane protein